MEHNKKYDSKLETNLDSLDYGKEGIKQMSLIFLSLLEWGAGFGLSLGINDTEIDRAIPYLGFVLVAEGLSRLYRVAESDWAKGESYYYKRRKEKAL